MDLYPMAGLKNFKPRPYWALLPSDGQGRCYGSPSNFGEETRSSRPAEDIEIAVEMALKKKLGDLAWMSI